LPDWPIERWRRHRADAPPAEAAFGLTEQIANMLRLSAVNQAARARGLLPGATLAGARALAPDLLCAPRPFAEEQADLKRLARWAMRYCPFVAPVPAVFEAQGLAFDISGLAHLYGAEGDLLAALKAGLQGLGFSARLASADTVGLAAALAGFDARAQAGFVAPPGAGLAAIAHLPTAALRLEAGLSADLAALGLKRVGDLSTIARASLARRFGQALLARLDAASGAIGEPIDPIAPASPLFALRRLMHPIATLPALQRLGHDLTGALCGRLEGAGMGLRQARLDLFGVDGGVTSVSVGFGAPETVPARIARIIAERLERALDGVDLGFGVEAGLLIATHTQARRAEAIDLDPHAARRAEAAFALSALKDALAAKLGAGAVGERALRDSHWPERAQTGASAPLDRQKTQPNKPLNPAPDRPLFLFARPEPIEAVAEIPDGPPRGFRWRRLHFRVARAQGPERIAPEWWGAGAPAQAPTRDYFRIETEEGRRLWLFREGLYGRETDRPRWFVHGAFP
jgi:protein ImuB